MRAGMCAWRCTWARGLGAMLAACTIQSAQAADLTPAASLRAVYLATNPVQAKLDPAGGEVRGPAAELARELARSLGAPLALRAVPGTADVSASVRAGEADIGFLAFDPVRALEVNFSQTYLLAHNSYIVAAGSAIRAAADVDRAGVRVGVGRADAADLFLSRNLRHAELRRFSGSALAEGLVLLERGEIEAYAANRTRLLEAIETRPGLRLLEDNFLSVQQAIIVAKGNARLLEAANRVIAAARASGRIREAIERAGLRGVDVAPPPQ